MLCAAVFSRAYWIGCLGLAGDSARTCNEIAITISKCRREDDSTVSSRMTEEHTAKAVFDENIAKFIRNAVELLRLQPIAHFPVGNKHAGRMTS